MRGKPGLGTLIRAVLRMAGEEQARADMQDTIEILLHQLALSDAPATQEILNTVKVFVFGVQEKILLKRKEVAPQGKAEAVMDDSKGLVARMIQKLEEERKEEVKVKEEILAAVNCPAEGFHGEEAEGDPKEGGEMEEETEPVLDQDQKFLKVVVER